MKSLKKLLYSLPLASLIASCASEEPFKPEADHLVKFNVTVDTGLTRAVEEESLQKLLDQCVIYISDETGLLHKWQGVSSLPASGIYLKYGEYVAEAWSGDSVPASFDSKFYKGLTRFNIGQGNITTQVTVPCRIANVVTSVDVSNFPQYLLKDLNISFNNADNELRFNSQNLYDKGYFMRPYNRETQEYDSKLVYTVSGKDIDGSDYSRSGEITNAQPGHEYRIIIENNPDEETFGGLNLKITVTEYEVVADEEVMIFGEPQFAWDGLNSDVESGIVKENGEFSGRTLLVGACDDFRSLSLSTTDLKVKSNFANNSEIEVINITPAAISQLQDLGLEFIRSIDGGRTAGYKIIFKKEWFDKFPARDESYTFNVTAVDKRGMSKTVTLSVLNSNLPFMIDERTMAGDLLSIGATEAEITINLLKDVDYMALQYRKAGEDIWNEQEIPLTKADNDQIKVKLKGLESDKDYEIKVVGGQKDGDSYPYQTSITKIHTEGKFIIPNSSMENWYQNNKPWIPGIKGEDYWDSGNAGSTTISANDNLTVKFTEFYHTGSACAALTSKFVGLGGFIGKHGAASLFTGEFAGTEQTTHGIIDLGREYNGSHPKAVRVWVNYRPAIATDKGGNDSYIKKGDLDKGQIYIALSTQIHRARTAYKETLITADNLPEEFIAYGQRTFDEDFGKDNTLEEVIIPFEYFEKAHTQAPKYLIILCAASKYGDYFSGGEGSVMYVDDFELIYDDINQ